MDKPIKVLTQKRLMTMMFDKDLLEKIRDDFPRAVSDLNG